MEDSDLLKYYQGQLDAYARIGGLTNAIMKEFAMPSITKKDMQYLMIRLGGEIATQLGDTNATIKELKENDL